MEHQPFYQAKEKQKVDSFMTLAEQRAADAASDGTDGAALAFLQLGEEPEPESVLNVLAEGVADLGDIFLGICLDSFWGCFWDIFWDMFGICFGDMFGIFFGIF